jgi:hypothetical protein
VEPLDALHVAVLDRPQHLAVGGDVVSTRPGIFQSGFSIQNEQTWGNDFIARG